MPWRSSPCSAWRAACCPHVLSRRLARHRRRGCATRSATGTPTGRCSGSRVALLLWTSRQAAWTGLRWLSVAALPAVLLALYFTYSRGGLLALVVAVGCLIALSRDRLWLLATLAIGALGALPAVLAVQARRSLADNLANQAAVDQGVTVLLILLAGIALALLLFAGAALGGAPRGRLTGRALRALAQPGAAAGDRAAGGGAGDRRVAIAVGGRAWDQFSSSDVQFPNQPEQHFAELSAAPGATTSTGSRSTPSAKSRCSATAPAPTSSPGSSCRSIELPVHDAHSLYLEAFAELGVGRRPARAGAGRDRCSGPGFAAWRARPRPAARALRGAVRRDARLRRRRRLRLVLGDRRRWARSSSSPPACWSPPAARSSPPTASRDSSQAARGAASASPSPALALAWIAAVALVGPLLVDREIDASQAAAADGDSAAPSTTPKRPARSSPGPPPPTSSSACWPSARATTRPRSSTSTQAIDREDRNWQLYYLRSRVEHEAGEPSRGQADLEQARELNPLAKCLRGEWNCG